MVGRRNESGMKIQCSHCGYTWLTQSERSVTSCPNCGWRVRLAPSRRGEINQPAGDFQSRPSEQIRYY
jgi:predicted  nucleic acid-binding Zn-ribbon protein